MTLGPSSILSLCIASTLLAVGCANGDVTGTGSPNRSLEDPSRIPAADDGTQSGSSGTSESPPADDGPIDYDALFDAPADPSTTDDLVTGLWAGTTYDGEVRVKITAGKVVIAIKCGSSPAEGMDVGAVITPTKMKMLASKSVGGYPCGIKVTPVEIPMCTSQDYYDCFDISGTTLTFSGKALFSSTTGGSSSQTYTKLSD